jgi:hypothetical protein
VLDLEYSKKKRWQSTKAAFVLCEKQILVWVRILASDGGMRVLPRRCSKNDRIVVILPCVFLVWISLDLQGGKEVQILSSGLLEKYLLLTL